MAIIASDLKTARKELLRGNLIGFPTETVYGLAGNALSSDAVLRIFSTKNRPYFDPLIVHTHGVDEIYKYVKEIPDTLRKLLNTFTPGPLTVLLPKNDLIPDIVTSGLEQVAFRIPNHPLALELLRLLPFPLAAPSANPFGYVSPTAPEHVDKQLGDKINFILDGGPCSVGVESTIIGLEDEKLVVYRAGGLTVENLAEFSNIEILTRQHSTSNPKAPGMLASHYAPQKKLLSATDIQSKAIKLKEVGYIGFDTYHPEIPENNQLLLSRSGNLAEAAKNLFSTLRAIEELMPQTFFVGNIPNSGLGRAINDRLNRAMSKV